MTKVITTKNFQFKFYILCVFADEQALLGAEIKIKIITTLIGFMNFVINSDREI